VLEFIPDSEHTILAKTASDRTVDRQQVMAKTTKHLLVFSGLFVVIICGSSVFGLAKLVYDHGPEVFFGQRTASREYKPLPPKKYASAEFVLGQIPLSEVEQAVFIYLPEDVLFWDPYYLGFPRIELEAAELARLAKMISSGSLISTGSESNSTNCVVKDSSGQASLIPCSNGLQDQDKIWRIESEAVLQKNIGVLIIQLKDGRLAEIRIFWSKKGFVYAPYEKAGPWWIEGVTAGSMPEIKTWKKSAYVASIPVLWPELSPEAANNLAASRLGGHIYWRAYEFIKGSNKARKILGEIQEMRPAAGTNDYSAWMDSQSATLTFKVVGSVGEAVVLIRGYECFDSEMVFRGDIIDISNGIACP